MPVVACTGTINEVQLICGSSQARKFYYVKNFMNKLQWKEDIVLFLHVSPNANFTFEEDGVQSHRLSLEIAQRTTEVPLFEPFLLK